MLLGLDTCGATGSVALAHWGGEEMSLIAQTELTGKTYSAQLIPRTHELLESHGASLAEIEAIVVVNGPGSFTGVRIGVSSTKALAEALGVPVIAVSLLAVLAEKGRMRAAALNAGRGELYFGIYAEEPFEALLSAVEVREKLGQSDSGLAICEAPPAEIFPVAMVVDPPTAWDALQFAAQRLSSEDFDDVEILDANYLRRSDAEIFSKMSSETTSAQRS